MRPGNYTLTRQDTLSGPLLRMSKFFLGDAIPAIEGAPDIYAIAKDLKARGVSPRPTEERLLTKILWCILQIQNDQEESEQHAALAMLAALVFAIIEDDDFYIPEGADTSTRRELELLAIDVMRDSFQLSMSLGASIGLYDIRIEHSRDLEGVRSRIPPSMVTPDIQAVFVKLGTHLTQGEQIFAGHADPERRTRHQARLAKAYSRATYLLARLLTIPQATDHPVVRAHLIRREHAHIEIDALGAERVTEADQVLKTKEYLSWTEDDLGETLTDENKAALAAKLRDIAREAAGDDPAETGSWFFDD